MDGTKITQRTYLWGVLQISFYVHLWVPTYAWPLIAPNLHIPLFQSVTMPASLLHAKKKSAALSFPIDLGLIYRAPLMREPSFFTSSPMEYIFDADKVINLSALRLLTLRH